MDTKGKSFLNAAPPIPSYERFQMSNVIETHKPDVWVHLWWALVWHKNLNFNNFVTVNSFIYNTQIFFWRERLIFSCFDTHFAEIIVLTKIFSGYLEWDFHVIFCGYLRWICWHISWSTDPTTNFKRTNPNFHDFFCQLNRTSFIVSFCLFVIVFFWLVNKLVKIQDS